MAPNISSEVQEVEETFNQAGFETLSYEEPFISNYSNSFNIIAIKPNQYVITKVTHNIDNVSDDDLLDITIIAKFLKGIPILVAKSNRRSELEKNAIYFRFDNQVIALSLDTLRQILLENIYPYKIAKRGSFISQFDGSKLQKQRQTLLISRKELSEYLGVSVKTIFEYEKGNINANIERLEQIEKYLGVELRIPYEIFKHINYIQKLKIPQNKPDPKRDDSDLLDEISELFEELGISQFWTKKTPFDVLINVPNKTESNNFNENLSMITSVFSKIGEEHSRRLQFISRLLNAMKINGTAIVQDKIDAKQCKLAGVPAIEHRELKEVKNPNDFKKLVIKKQ